MTRKKYTGIFTGIVILLALFVFLMKVVVDPWLGKKITSVLNNRNKNFRIEIERVEVSVFSQGIELKNIIISEKQKPAGDKSFKGTIESLKFKGFSMVKAIFRKDIDINEVIISNIIFNGKILFPGKEASAIISPMNIHIGTILIDKAELDLEDFSSPKSYWVKEGYMKLYNVDLNKNDTLSPRIVRKFDFEAMELATVSTDSMYTYSGSGIVYSSYSNKLEVKSFIIHPNHTNYDFTSRYEYQTNRFEGVFSNIFFYGFKAENFLSSGNMSSSLIEIGEMDLKVFRDKRKKFRHVNKPSFQEMIYNFPGYLRIDSILVISGNIIYTEHAEKAKESGSLIFSKLHATIYQLSNDTLYKTQKAYFQLKADALLMGKGELNVLLKGKLYDNFNTFSLEGTLLEMEVVELNPFLEKTSFLSVISGKIEKMNFSFIANNSKANGTLTMIYHGLVIELKNKQTDDKSGLKERFISFLLNWKVLNSNPIENENVRVGIIEYERDPERFLFYYCAKSILTGLKTSLVKSPGKMKKK